MTNFYPHDLKLQSRILSLPLEIRTLILDNFIYSSFENLKLGVLLSEHHHTRYRETLFRYMKLDGVTKLEFHIPEMGLEFKMVPELSEWVIDQSLLSPIESAGFDILSTPRYHRSHPGPVSIAMQTFLASRSARRWFATCQSVIHLTLVNASDMIVIDDALSYLRTHDASDPFKNVEHISFGAQCTGSLCLQRDSYTSEGTQFGYIPFSLQEDMKFSHVCFDLYLLEKDDEMSAWYLPSRFEDFTLIHSFTFHGVSDYIYLHVPIQQYRIFLLKGKTESEHHHYDGKIAALCFDSDPNEPEEFVEVGTEIHVLNWEHVEDPCEPDGHPPQGTHFTFYNDQDGDACSCCGKR